MTETEIGPSRSATLNIDALLRKPEFEIATTREGEGEGCYIITEPIHLSGEGQASETLSNPELTTDSSESGALEAVHPKMLPTITRISSKLPAQDSFLLMQKWQGVVTQIGDDSFLATLKDLITDSDDEEAEIYTEEISKSDIPLLAKGAVFYWCIGYRDTLAGQRIRASEIRFRRLPTWSKRELDTARKEADSISELLKWK
jgi:hypothetical protein